MNQHEHEIWCIQLMIAITYASLLENSNYLLEYGIIDKEVGIHNVKIRKSGGHLTITLILKS